ncbi:MAG: MgtC/SapB family protein [Clostridia bacterium]|nr:MgtC/SapB family protein [Clostridia bacterium]
MELSYLDTTIRLVVAMLAGAIIGYERTKKRKPAGIRTHALVCIASASLTIISAYGVQDFVETRSMDPLRLASQIVSGIGFLGAGVIWKESHGDIRGLTTATNIWAAAGLGIAAGLGHFYLVFLTIVLLRIALKIAYILEKLGLITYETTCNPHNGDDKIDECKVNNGD